MIISVLSCIILSESLKTNALTNTIPEQEQYTPELFNIGTFYLSINVSQTEFSPVEFTVKRSATVNLTIKSIDIGHSFEILEYDINETIEASTSINIAFVADKLGSFTYSSINSTTTGTMTVTDPYVPDLPQPEDITILFDFSHNENSTAMAEKYDTIYNWTAEKGFSVSDFDGSQITPEILEGVNLLIVLEPTEEFTEFEIEDIISFIRDGGSLLIGGSSETAYTNVYEITQPFGFDFDNASAMYVNATTVSIGENNTLAAFNITNYLDHPIISETQYVPLTDELVTTIQYDGTLLNFNVTWAEENIPHDNLTDSEELVDAYVLANGYDKIFADENGDLKVGENETIGENNTFIVAAETTYNGRVFGIGSADVFNNSMIGRNEGNGYLYQRSIQWLTKMYAILQSNDFTLSTYSAKSGEAINVSVNVFAQNNTELDTINVSLRVWRNQELQATIYLTTANNTYYDGEIDIADQNISKGIHTVHSLAHKRGYGYNLTNTYAIEVYPKDRDPFDLPIPYIITYAAAIIIGIAAFSFFFVRVLKTPKTTIEDVEEIEEEIDEDMDLEEYESDETDEYESE